MKISILLPGNTNRPTGGYKVIYEYCNRLSEYGHKICIYYYYGSMFNGLHLPEFIRKPLVKVFSELVGPGLWFKLDKKIKKRVISSPKKIEEADAIIATAVDTAKDVKELPPSCGNKFYLIQGFENWNYSNAKVFESYNYGMTNIAVAKWLKNIVDKHASSAAYFIPNAINTDVFYNEEIARKEHSIVFHYRSDKCKGSEYALAAIRILEKKFKDLSVEVISIEKKPDNLPDCCNYHHKITAKEVAKINNKVEIFMCTSIEEGFGLPGLEAMACGCAVVSTSYKGVFEYAVDGENALLVPVGDINALVAKIELLFENKELRKRIVSRGLQTGKDKSIDNSARLFEKIIQEGCKI